MNMVFGTSDTHWGVTHLFDNTSNVGMQFRQVNCGNQCFAIFYREDDM